MNNRKLIVRSIKILVYLAMISLVIYLTVHWGIEEKPWWDKFLGTFIGTGTGALVGLVAACLLSFGAVGWVSGLFFGAISPVALITGGALGGASAGSLIDIVRRPDNYIFHWQVIIPTFFVGSLIARGVSAFIGRKLDQWIMASAPARTDRAGAR